MKKFLICLPILFLLIAAQDSPLVAISSPASNDVLRGQVNIIGSTDAPDFVSAQLDFAYASDSTGTWFPIQALSQPVFDSPLHTWDTTTITDGDYILRLRVIVADGSFQEVTVPVRVQNEVLPATLTALPPPTETPESVSVLIPTPFLLASSPTPTEPPRPTPTPLPANPASLNSTTVLRSLGRGALVILGLFAFTGIILRLRRP